MRTMQSGTPQRKISAVTTSDETRIRELSEGMRQAILRTPVHLRTPGLEYFPRGSCGDASLLLHTLLRDAGIGGSNVVSAERGSPDGQKDWTSHAWVKCGALVIDITADHFDPTFPTVYVGEASAFHLSFAVESESEATLDQCAGTMISVLIDLYGGYRSQLLHRAETS
jgi:hypothetical protein